MSVIGDDNNTLDSSNHSNISLEDYSQLRMRKSVPYKTKQQEEDDRRELLKIEAAVQKNLREGALPLLMRHETHDEEDHEEGDVVDDRDISELLLDDNDITLIVGDDSDNEAEQISKIDANLSNSSNNNKGISKGNRSPSQSSPHAQRSKGGKSSPKREPKKWRKKQHKLIMEQAQRSNKWLLFHDTNIFDKEEVKSLKHFMEITMHKVPGTFWGVEESLEYGKILDDNVSVTSNISGDNNSSKHNSKQRGSGEGGFEELIQTRRRESFNSTSGESSADTSDVISLSTRLSSEKLLTLALPDITSNKRALSEKRDSLQGRYTLDTVKEIIDAVKSGALLATDRMHRLLRRGYKHLKTLGNVNHLDLQIDEELVIVGDLHGQLGDLLHILEEAGMPSRKQKYVFNGDFVDRGNKGCEVMAVLLVLLLAEPENVFLNRGNHEDFAICCAYGFQRECCDKYDEVTFGMFCELFRQLSLMTVVNKSVLVIHGGLSRHMDIKLAELESIPRAEFSLRDMPEGGESLDTEHMDTSGSEYYNQLTRDILWSDPTIYSGLLHSSRGAGVSFGPDVVERFLNNNNLDLIVRSHECVDKGFDFPFLSADPKRFEKVSKKLCTIFSASNYGGYNDGAYMRLRMKAPDGPHCMKISPNSNLHFMLATYNIHAPSADEEGEEGHVSQDHDKHVYLSDLLIDVKDVLAAALVMKDTMKDGTVSSADWAQVLEDVTKLHIRWISMIPVLVPADSVTERGRVSYNDFLMSIGKKLDAGLAPREEASDDGMSINSTDEGNAMIDALYSQHKHLETVYRFFDVDNTGFISRDHFLSGCALLNKTLPNDLHFPESVWLDSCDELFDLLDIDDTNDISMNAFFEVYRILHTKEKDMDAGVDDAGNVHLGLGDIIVRSDTETETINRQESRTKRSSIGGAYRDSIEGHRDSIKLSDAIDASVLVVSPSPLQSSGSVGSFDDNYSSDHGDQEGTSIESRD